MALATASRRQGQEWPQSPECRPGDFLELRILAQGGHPIIFVE